MTGSPAQDGTRKFTVLITDGDKTHYKEFNDRFKAANLVAMMLDLLTSGDRIVIEVVGRDPKRTS